jgi:hypothetical protein
MSREEAARDRDHRSDEEELGRAYLQLKQQYR